MVSLSAASHTLGNSAIGTGTLNVSRLFNVDGWVAVGEWISWPLLFYFS